MQPVFMLRILDSYVHSLFSCVCIRVLQFPWTYDLTCVWMSLHTHTWTCVHMFALRNPYLTIVASFSLVFSSDCHSNVLFSSCLQISPPFLGRGSTNCIASWYKALIDDTKAFICVVDFEPIIRLLPKSHTSAILVQSLVERWWNITHTFHIVDREMTMTPHDFHRMTSLRCDGTIINLKGKSGVQLGIELLGWKYMTNTIHYFDIEIDYKPLP